MSINPGGAANYGWNYSKPDKEGYSTSLVGTVVSIQEVQKRSYTMNGQPGAPEFWPDGNPKMNIRLGVATETGELKAFVFQPAGKEARAGRKPSIHMELWHLTGDTDMKKLVGMTIAIWTQEGYYGQGHPRPWYCQVMDGVGPYQLSSPLPDEFKVPQLLCNSSAAGGQVTPPQQAQPMQQQPQYQQPPMQPQQQRYQYQQQAPQYPPMQQQYQPPMQQQYQQPPMQQPQQYQPPMPQPQQPQGYPAGMDPNIAMAMQTLGATSVEVVQPEQPADPVGTGEVYDEDMPF